MYVEHPAVPQLCCRHASATCVTGPVLWRFSCWREHKAQEKRNYSTVGVPSGAFSQTMPCVAPASKIGLGHLEAQRNLLQFQQERCAALPSRMKCTGSDNTLIRAMETPALLRCFILCCSSTAHNSHRWHAKYRNLRSQTGDPILLCLIFAMATPLLPAVVPLVYARGEGPLPCACLATRGK